MGKESVQVFWPCQRNGCGPPIVVQEPEFCSLLSNWQMGFSPELWLYGSLNDGTTVGLAFQGSVDALIRADQIDSLHLRQMRKTKKYPPRVEARLIGDLTIGDLREGAVWSGDYEFRPEPTAFANACVIGRIAGNPDESMSLGRDCLYDPSNDFASIVYANIGCIGPQGHVWYRDCPRFRIDRSCLGGLHVPTLNAGQTIWIGDRLGRSAADDQAYCDCLGNDPPQRNQDPNNPPFECGWRCPPSGDLCRADGPDDGVSVLPNHPLHMETTNDDRLRMGLISVGDHLGSPLGDDAIHGQIIINGANHPPIIDNSTGIDVVVPRWKGKVTTGPTHPRQAPVQGNPTPCHTNDFTPIPETVLRPLFEDHSLDPNQNTTAPYYKARPSHLGGGSIGEAPFHLHNTACDPVHKYAFATADRALATITHSSFYQLGTQIKIRSYGPIRPRMLPNGTRRAWQSSVRIDALSETPGQECVATDMTFMFTVRGAGDSGWNEDDRTITLSAGQYLSPRPGVYRVVPLHVVCFDVKDEPDVVWAQDCEDIVNGSYKFRIAPDCNQNLQNDYKDILLNPTIDIDPMDGNIDACVLSQSEKCRADFNRSGSVTVQDIFDFLNNWFILCTGPSTRLGEPCFGTADFNHSGTITVQDIFDFLNTWFESGGGANCQ